MCARACIRAYVCVRVRAYVHVCVRVRAYVHMCVCVCVHMCVCVYVKIITNDDCRILHVHVAHVMDQYSACNGDV